MSDECAEKRVVWVLGSGFSKSLGGPLLNDLLSYRGEAFVRAKFPKLDRATYDLYRRHLRGHPSNSGQPVYWDHAEEFLDFVSTATREGSKERYDILLESLYPEPTLRALLTTKAPDADVLQEIRTNTVRCLAGECLFTTHSSTRSEVWRPYIAWAKALKRYDTIISFNYDMVLEKLATEVEARENLDHPLRFGADSVLAPHRADEDLPRGRTVRILKLHGSVGWFSYGDNAFGTAITDAAAAQKLAENTIPFVVGPGPDKLIHQEGTFRKLWEQAARHLEVADVVVFLGYRFPPSDSQSRSVILAALKANQAQALRIHTVLGPRTHDDDTVRLLKLLEHALRGAGRIKVSEARDPRAEPRFFEIVSQPLYVEDFLTVLHPRELYGEVQQGLVLTGREGADLAFEKQAHYFHVLDTDPDLQVVAMTPGGGLSSAYRPEPTEEASRLNNREMTVWCDFELHNRSAQLLRNVVIELEFGDARVDVEGAASPNVVVHPSEELPGGGRIFQSVRQINPWAIEKLATLCIRPYGSARPKEIAESHGKFVVNGEAGIISTGRFVVRCKVGETVELTLRHAYDRRD